MFWLCFGPALLLCVNVVQGTGVLMDTGRLMRVNGQINTVFTTGDSPEVCCFD